MESFGIELDRIDRIDELIHWYKSYRLQKINEQQLIRTILQQQIASNTELITVREKTLDPERLVYVWDWNLYIIEKLSNLGLFCSFSQISELMKKFGYSIFVYTNDQGKDESFYYEIQYKNNWFPERREIKIQKLTKAVQLLTQKIATFTQEMERKMQFTEIENTLLRETCE